MRGLACDLDGPTPDVPQDARVGTGRVAARAAGSGPPAAGRSGGCTAPKAPPRVVEESRVSFREPGDRRERAAYGPAACATAVPAWIMPSRSGMTRSAPTSPPTPVADAQRAVETTPPRECCPGQGRRRAHAGPLFAIREEDRWRPIAPRKGYPDGRPPRREQGSVAGERARPRRVVIIGCEPRLFVNTRSKNCAMTVRQIGWLKVHLSLGQKTENMIPSFVTGVGLSRPWVGVALRQGRSRPASWVCRSGDRRDRPLGIAKCSRSAVPQATGVRHQGKTGRRTGRSINNALRGHGGEGRRVCAPVARGVRYNWKGPPIKLPLRTRRGRSRLRA
jgi:hypothetical protein